MMEPDLAEFPCTNCTERVGAVHVECTKCDDLRLCLECFSCGAELGDHLRIHPYKIRNTAGKCIFNEELSNSSSEQPWQASEELTMLDAVERFNLGNWEDVVKIVNPTRSAKELRDHYDKFYIRGKIGQKTMKNLTRPIIHDHGSEIGPTTSNMSPELKESVARINVDDLTMLAYMPNRDDFEKEWNNEAETLISNLIVMQDDDELDRAVKLAQIDMYIRQMAERKRRKALIREYDLVPKFFKQEKPQFTLATYCYAPKDMQRRKLERELKDELKTLSQFLPPNEFDQLVAGLIKEKALKERIEELQEFRKNGITSLQDAVKFRSEQMKSQTTDEDEEKNSNSTVRLKKEGKNAGSDSIQTLLEPSETGTECVDGKNEYPNRSRQTFNKFVDVLSDQEKELCKIASLQECDYLLLKMSILKEQTMKNYGVPLRKGEISSAKENVKEFMKSSGWIPIFS